MSQRSLRREIGVFGAMMMGMGSIVGTGVFVSIGIAADVAGAGVLLAIVLAALVAICNGLSSAQLAANHPVSGGTYEYGHRWLTPALGFAAGWMFLCAKSASAATAALGFAGYLQHLLGDGAQSWAHWPLALAALIALTFVVLTGIRRSNWVNTGIVTLTLASLAYYCCAGLETAWQGISENIRASLPQLFSQPTGFARFCEATALMFVAYTGYGRIATLGEEVKHPRTTIPRAVICTLAASMTLYVAVAFVSVGSVGAQQFADLTRSTIAPLEMIALQFNWPGVAVIVSIGAVTAMLGVMLNLLLGLSRVLLAMGRRHDMPAVVAQIHPESQVPRVATIAIAVGIMLLVMIGDVKLTWSFSALTVLVYYALTNWCAIRLAPAERLFPIWPAYGGLIGCLFLAFWVDTRAWIGGFALLVIGFGLRGLVHRLRPLAKSQQKRPPGGGLD